MFMFVNSVIGIVVFGICVSFLIAVMLSVPPEEPLGLRPTACLRSCLSSNFWVPIAILSYSMYLYHRRLSKKSKSFFNAAVEQLDPNGEPCACGLMTAIGLWVADQAFMIIVSMLLSTCSFILVEKPGIDARSVYKHKVQIARMKQDRIEWLKRHGPGMR